MNIGAILIEIVLPAVLTVAVLFVNGLLDRQPQAFPPMARDPLHSAGPSHRRKLARLWLLIFGVNEAKWRAQAEATLSDI